MSHTFSKNIESNEDKNDGIQNISSFRRVFPQLLGSLAKNLLLLNVGEFIGFMAIVISSLSGLSKEQNPNETIQITADEASWLPTFIHVAHPIGGLLSGPINDKFGRRKALIMVNIPLVIGWIILGFCQSFAVICVMFTLFGLCFGLKEAPSFTYITEISEPSMRGTMMTISNISMNVGIFVVMAFGSVLSWRQVSFICAIFPICCLIAVFFVPESPFWLLSKNRPNDAQKSLQWLRGWVTPQTVQKEFDELQSYSNTSNACSTCEKQSISCIHPRPTFYDKIKELKRRRNILPLILIFCLQFFGNFNLSGVWDPYIIQVLNALGTPIKPNLTTILISGVGISGTICLMLIVKKMGRRKIYLTSIMVLALCYFGLGIYGFVFFPPGWISFKKDPNEPAKDLQLIREMVGNYSYLALTLILIIRFFSKVGVDIMAILYVGEIFPFKSRSFLCGIAIANHYLLAAIATKTYYNVETWLSLPGAILFYGFISLIGFIVMYFIMPETEQRSLEDIEVHFSDRTKGLTDIHNNKNSKFIEK